VVGEFGHLAYAVSEIILKNNLADYVASDAHSIKRRPPILSKTYFHISNHYNAQYADKLFYTNPRYLTNALFEKYN
jgi:protein-tyrosine phosphatase